MRIVRLLVLGVVPLGLCATIGCNSHKHDLEVVAYATLDPSLAEPIFEDFKTEFGVAVLSEREHENAAGLAQAIVREAGQPRCDVYWENEVLQTIRLERMGMLEEYHSPADANFPEMYRSPTGAWHGLAARARVLIVNTEKIPLDKIPGSILDLAAPEWSGQVGIASPLYGATATHAACLFATWGDVKAKEFFHSLKGNQIEVCVSDKAVAIAVGLGKLSFGLTDSDAALEEVDKKQPVIIIYPDQHSTEIGALFIPNTVAIIKGCPHPPAARMLVDYALSPQVEERLAVGQSAQIPLGSLASFPSRLRLPAGLRQMKVDFNAAADAWETARTFLSEEFGP